LIETAKLQQIIKSDKLQQMIIKTKLQQMLKIAVIGPESTGKTGLCRALALHYDCVWEPELARGYIENLSREYTRADVEEIARLQIEQEKKYETAGAGMVFFDTDLIITKVWFQHKYHAVPSFVEERLCSRYFDFYLIAMPDIPWEYDPVRENGDKREFFLDWYEREVWALGTPYEKVQGIGDKRLQNAVKAVDEFLMRKYKYFG